MIKETIGTKQNYTKKDINDKLSNKVNKTDEQWESKAATINLPSLEIENEEISAVNLPCSKNDVNKVIKRFNSSTGVVAPDIASSMILGNLEFTIDGEGEKVSLYKTGDFVGAVWDKEKCSLVCSDLKNNSSLYLNSGTIPGYDNTCFYKIDIYLVCNYSQKNHAYGDYICYASKDGENYTKTINNSPFSFYVRDGNTSTLQYHYHSHIIKPNENFNYIKFCIQRSDGSSTLKINERSYIRISKYLAHKLPLFQ